MNIHDLFGLLGTIISTVAIAFAANSHGKATASSQAIASTATGLSQTIAQVNSTVQGLAAIAGNHDAQLTSLAGKVGAAAATASTVLAAIGGVAGVAAAASQAAANGSPSTGTPQGGTGNTIMPSQGVGPAAAPAYAPGEGA